MVRWSSCKTRRQKIPYLRSHSFSQPARQQLPIGSYYVPGNVPSVSESTVNQIAKTLILLEFPL